MKLHRFKKSLTVGEQGEQLFGNYYPGQVEWAGGREYDFTILLVPNGKTELKSDDYPKSDTPNFFIERYSNDRDYKPGGPYSAYLNGVDYFIYQYLKDKKLFVFKDLLALVSNVDYYALINQLPLTPVQNKVGRGMYNTLGYKIPREALSHLYKEINLGDRLPI
jgi:hypothetical protein